MKISPQLLNRFESVKVLIIGDVMIDSYLWGKVDRISPEAPVPVVSVSNRDERLGGAANVALNIQALGATAVLCGVTGKDEKGRLFNKLLQEKKLSSEGIVSISARPTTVKTRIIAGDQQMLRVDQETDTPLSESETNKLFSCIDTILQHGNIDVVLFEDYDKGVITPTLIQRVVKVCRASNIPVCVDPKKRNFLDYKGVTLFKPNLKELNEGLKVDLNGDDLPALKNAAARLSGLLGSEMVLITLSKHGVVIYHNDNLLHVPAHPRDIADVSGAGDTVISVASLCLALNQKPEVIAAVSNLAGGLVCEKVGVVPVDPEALRKEIKTLNQKDVRTR